MNSSDNTQHFASQARLIIDFGNSRTKAAVFKDSRLIELVISSALTVEDIRSLKNKFHLKQAMIASVIDLPEEVRNYLNSNFSLMQLDHLTPIPIGNQYKTPETLGKDRLAMVVAASRIFPDKNCLVIGAGTCITYDFIDRAAKYQGGAISPGISLRFKALHNFTSKLPLVSIKENVEITGTNTEESILSGVLIGATYEIDGTIATYRAIYDDLEVILTGGDMIFFQKTLKSRIFAASNLVLIGLNEILDFNVNKK